jgi:hypothetical protein
MASRLGIIAGGGPLPRRLIDSCRTAGRPVHVVAFKSQTDEGVPDDVPQTWTRLGSAGKILGALRDAGVEEVCLAGTFRRPSWFEMMPDRRAASFLSKVNLSSLGDDALLQVLAEVLEKEEGFRVVPVQEILDNALARPGLLTRTAPDDGARGDIARGFAVARAIGTVDGGQGAVVQQGIVLAVEAAEGTDAMLDRCAGLRRDGPGGVLVKARKPQQDDRLDLPTIGITTVERAAAAGLRGIAVEAGAALIVDPDAVAAAADERGLFVLCTEPET